MIIQEEKNVETVEDTKKQENKTTEKKEKTKNKKTHHLLICSITFIVVLLVILITIFFIFSLQNIKNSNHISNGIYIYGIDISGLTKDEAKEKITSTFKEITSKDIKLVNGNFSTYINSSEMGLSYNIDAAINYAYKIGKTGNILSDSYIVFDTIVNGVNITPTYSINEKLVKEYLQNLSKDIPNAVVQSSYYVEGSKLILTKGTDGYEVNIEQTLHDIKLKLSDFSYLKEPVELTLSSVKAKEIDLDKVYKEVYKKAKDAYYTTNPFTVHPSETGIDFAISLDEAKKLLSKSGSECEIALKTTYPSITTNMIGTEAFPDLLATFTTRYYTGNTNRVTNLKLAAGKINGTVLLPGETFSYNGVVGKRTIAAGYKEAGVYSNGQEVMGLGGGICQISTTLFNAALLANLKITEIHNHQFVPQYSSTGRDATVVYGTKDFKFKNSRKYAIKLVCSVSGGYATFKIFGVKEPTEYDVKISVSITSKTSTYTKSATYRTLSLNGKKISTEKIYNCTYKVH